MKTEEKKRGIISDIEGEPRWGAQYDALLPSQPARETIWKCLHSLGNNSKKSIQGKVYTGKKRSKIYANVYTP